MRQLIHCGIGVGRDITADADFDWSLLLSHRLELLFSQVHAMAQSVWVVIEYGLVLIIDILNLSAVECRLDA